MNKTPIIDTTRELREFARFLGEQPVIAVDLEADSMHHYTEKVCLLQFTAAGRTALVDPLALPDLEPLRAPLEDSAIRKLFHAADYDLRCLRRDFDLQVRGLFDSMLAAQFCGEEKIGLADLLGKYFGLEIDKKYQRADWTVRPLPEEMVAYAAGDTAFLDWLAGLLEERLRQLDRLFWLEEECRLLQEVAFENGDGPLFMRFKGAGRLGRRQLAILEALLRWRDKRARRRDVPPFRIIGNKSLLSVATAAPRTLRAMAGLEGLSPKLIDRYGRELLRCVEEGLSLPVERLPSFPRRGRQERDPRVEERLARLKAWRTAKAADLGLDPGVLINNSLLEAVARLNPRRETELQAIEGMRDWQRQVLGAELLACL
ncbi:ribonuclease D [Geothermobacter ehrlichii]|uniref:Ribonuclease D n=1 Tax=Geothermobacter ehrlichii TaxID=213224 RepID=A0A5D3WEE7_9BACT|nr:ribonuclease D [Geothermobacter ehrlichii]TYO95435.1 ribonuclease D [Geothermobacter ehrlichii]